MTAKVTEALQLIRSTQRMEEARVAGKTTMPCLKAIRFQMAAAMEEVEEAAAEEEDANGGGVNDGAGGGGANGVDAGDAIVPDPPPLAWNYVLQYMRAGRANDGEGEGLIDFDNEENVEDAEAALEGNGAAAAAAAAAAGAGSI